MFDLRAELFELLDELKELKYSCVDGVAQLLDSWKVVETTRCNEAYALIPNLRKKKVRMQLLKTRFIEKSKTSPFASQEDIPNSSPAPRPSATQQSLGFTYEACITMQERLT